MEMEALDLAGAVAFEFDRGGDDVVFKTVLLGLKDGRKTLAGEFDEKRAASQLDGEDFQRRQEVVGAGVFFEFLRGTEDIRGRELIDAFGGLFEVVLIERDAGDGSAGIAGEEETRGDGGVEEDIVFFVLQRQKSLAGEFAGQAAIANDEGEFGHRSELEDADIGFELGFAELGAFSGLEGLLVELSRDGNGFHFGVIDEHDADLIGFGHRLKLGAITAGAAVVPDEAVIEEKAAADVFGERFDGKLDGFAQRRGFGMIQSAAEEHQIRRGAVQAARRGEDLEAPFMRGVFSFKGRRESAAQVSGEHLHRIQHAEGLADAVADEIGPGVVERSFEDVAEKGDADVGVAEVGGSSLFELRGGEPRGEFFRVVGGVGVCGAEVGVVWQAEEAAGVRGELRERDSGDFFVSEGLIGPEGLFQRGFKGEFFLQHGLREQKAGEDLADGADLERDFLRRHVFRLIRACDGIHGFSIAPFAGGDAAAREFLRGVLRRSGEGERLLAPKQAGGAEEQEKGPKSFHARSMRDGRFFVIGNLRAKAAVKRPCPSI